MSLFVAGRFLDGDDLMFRYDPELIRQFTSRLTRDTVSIFLRSKEIPPEKLDLTEPWFGTKYSSETVPTSWLAK